MTSAPSRSFLPDTPADASADVALQSRPADATAALRQWDSASLLGGQPEALIQHGGQTYRLRRTALGKLILTK